MATIHILQDFLISQIAAGEVVERPASVVKELVENALDAGATSIEVELEAGGKRRITVTDDGIGMDGDDSLLAFDRHATSKIARFEDLERVGTLGFRGEALASIAAVARVEMITAQASGDGHRVRIEGGRVRIAEPAARARGTTVEVASLFFNVPARRKFLKAPATELRRAVEVVQGYALARSEVRFRVVHQGRPLLDALPAGEGVEGLRQRIGQIFGKSLAGELAEIPPAVRHLGEGSTGEEGTERIGGLVGSPATARGRRTFVFVNRRLLRDRAVLATFYRAVREEWRSEDFPSLFLFLDLPPEEVDVNVHPQKAEVRFRDPGLLDRVGAILRDGLARALGEEAAPLKTPAHPPAQPFAWQGLGGRHPKPAAPGLGASGVGASGVGGPARGGPPERGSYPVPGQGLPETWEVRQAEGPPPPPDPGSGAPPVGTPQVDAPPAGTSPAPGALPRTPAGGPFESLARTTYSPFERAPVPLSGRSGEPRPFRLLGQYKGTLILFEGPDGLYLIDQHVAHERILYERLRHALNRERPPSQRLLHPVLLDLAPAERLRLAELIPPLEEVGFGISELSGDTLGLTAVPAVLSVEEGEKILLSLAAEGVEDRDDPAAVRRSLLEALAAEKACKAAVKMHHPLKPQEMEALVAELFTAEQPYACPHGRPIVLLMTDADLERRFGRR